jgi:hypothetical protein
MVVSVTRTGGEDLMSTMFPGGMPVGAAASAAANLVADEVARSLAALPSAAAKNAKQQKVLNPAAVDFFQCMGSQAQEFAQATVATTWVATLLGAAAFASGCLEAGATGFVVGGVAGPLVPWPVDSAAV